MASAPTKKIVFVVGGTGAQGRVICNFLCPPGQTSPYHLRILTRNPEHPSTQKLYGGRQDIELVKGSFTDLSLMVRYLDGCYGVFVNTDGWTEGPAQELFVGIRLWELANFASVKHFIYSAIPYASKLAGYNPEYAPQHMDTRGRVEAYLSSQPSSPGSTMWTVIRIGLYMECLHEDFFSPTVEADGSRSFVLPFKQGHVWLYSLEDGAYWVRKIFDHPLEWSGRIFDALGEAITGQGIADAFMEATGLSATYTACDYDTWADHNPAADAPVSRNDPRGLTWRENFRMFFGMWGDDAILHGAPDLTERRQLHPDGARTVAQWMKRVHYDGIPKKVLALTKN